LESSNNKKERLRNLFESGHWSEEDRRWLLEYLDTQDPTALRRLMEEHFQADAAVPQIHPEEGRLLALIHDKINPEKTRARPFYLLGRGWRKLAVAALFLLIAGKAVLYFHSSSPDPKKIQASHTPAIYAQDLPPGRNNALLTLADGSTITLDSAANGGLAQQGNTKVIKLNGQITYRNTGSTQGEEAILQNTITTARGNQYQLILSDGSKVWLNAASSLRFPTSFKGKERRVEITGEAYFEIAKNASMPFKVIIAPISHPSKGEHSDGREEARGEIEVLGTHFNVNAYMDESSVKTTLLEGVVAIKKDNAFQKLSPGEQAEFTPQGEITLSKNVDVTQETAWKDGFFWFNNTDIYTLMRQVSRWYDVEVEFKGKVTDDGFTGKVSRNVPLSKLLNVLELYEIHFKVEGKKITVLP
jgi:ferric-dicitrate binding protein FerR (iron transport regulator)